MKDTIGELGIPYIFKASYDKANCPSKGSFRGAGLAEGLRILAEVRRQIGVPVLTDVHEDTPMAEVAAVVDVLQTPAFLCPQTNFILSAASQGSRSTSRRASSSRPGTSKTWWTRPAPPAMSRPWCVSAACPSVTTP